MDLPYILHVNVHEDGVRQQQYHLCKVLLSALPASRYTHFFGTNTMTVRSQASIFPITPSRYLLSNAALIFCAARHSIACSTSQEMSSTPTALQCENEAVLCNNTDIVSRAGHILLFLCFSASLSHSVSVLAFLRFLCLIILNFVLCQSHIFCLFFVSSLIATHDPSHKVRIRNIKCRLLKFHQMHLPKGPFLISCIAPSTLPTMLCYTFVLSSIPYQAFSMIMLIMPLSTAGMPPQTVIILLFLSSPPAFCFLFFFCPIPIPASTL